MYQLCEVKGMKLTMTAIIVGPTCFNNLIIDLQSYNEELARRAQEVAAKCHWGHDLTTE